jgi:hypothetical protein
MDPENASGGANPRNPRKPIPSTPSERERPDQGEAQRAQTKTARAERAQQTDGQTSDVRAFFDFLLQVAIGRREDAHVDLDWKSVTHRDDLLLFQHAEYLGLHLRRHLGNLVEEDHAARARTEDPRTVPNGTRERTAPMTEQFTFEQRLGQSRTIDRNERPLAARTCAMNSRATNSLPVPVSPSINTVIKDVDALSIRLKTSSISGPLPTISVKRLLRARSRRKTLTRVSRDCLGSA